MKQFAKQIVLFAAGMVFAALASVSAAEEMAPYGTAGTMPVQFKQPLKMAFSVISTADNAQAILQQSIGVLKQFGAGAPKGSEVVVVVIGGVIGAFAKENYEKFQPQMDALAELVRDGSGGTKVRVVLCGNSTKNAGYKFEDLHGFGQVAAHGGYVELARLAQEGYAIAPIEIVKTPGSRYFFRPDLKPVAK